MASPTIVRHVTEALLGILKSRLSVGPMPIVQESNVIAAPPELIDGISSQTLILYLYQVIESPFLKNVGPSLEIVPPTVPGQSQGVRVRKDPLALDLYFLLIPGAQTGGSGYLDTYNILGEAMLAFHDQSIFALGEFAPDPLPEESDLQFRIDFNRLEMSDLIRVWEAVQKPYRLSVSYVVRTLQIESQLVNDSQLVTERNFRLEQM